MEKVINTVADFQECLEHGPYAWPGGYPCFFLCSDGECLSFEAAKENAALIVDAIESKDWRSGWHVVAFGVNWEDTDVYCAHTGKRIPSAYGEDD